MIKAIIFDCFGVLTTDGWLAFREKYVDGRPDIIEQASVSNKRVDAGLISYNDFIHEVAELVGIADKEAVAVIENRTPNNKLFDYIGRRLKPSYKIGMLSNAAGNWLDELFEPEQTRLFDAAVFSYEVGAIKPDPIMYQTIAVRLGVQPGECVYIDDIERYAQGATDAGMKAIHFTDTTSTVMQIEELLSA